MTAPRFLRTAKFRCWLTAAAVGASPLLLKLLLVAFESIGCGFDPIYGVHCPPVAGIDPGPLATPLFGLAPFAFGYAIPLGVIIFLLCGFLSWQRGDAPATAQDSKPAPSSLRLGNVFSALGLLLMLILFGSWLTLTYSAHSALRAQLAAQEQHREQALAKRTPPPKPAPELTLAPAPPPARRATGPLQYFAVAVDQHSGRLWFRSAPHDAVTFNSLHRVDPVSGEAQAFAMPGGRFDFSTEPLSVAVPDGLIVIGGRYIEGKQWRDDPGRVAFLTLENTVLEARLHQSRTKARTLVLRDGSLLLVGGIAERYRNQAGEQLRFTNAVERIALRDGAVVVEALPALPGPVRRDVALVQLDDGRVLALGGSSSQYRGMMPISAEGWLLDLDRRQWQPGLSLRQPRSAAAASLLPNGQVLVTGGWTPDHTWQEGPARSTELLNPRSGAVVAAEPLPIGLAEHQALWAPGAGENHLLLAGGTVADSDGNHELLVYDAALTFWHGAGSACPEHQSSPLLAYAYLRDGTPRLWCERLIAERHAGAPALLAQPAVSLRLPGDGDAVALATERPGAAVLASTETAPGLIAGGVASTDRYGHGAASAFAELSWPERRQPLAPLNVARQNAVAFRLRDGSLLVAGGRGNERRRDDQALPMELLSGPDLANARWHAIEERLPKETVVAQAADGSLIAAGPEQRMERLDLAVDADGRATLQHSPLPPLTFARRKPMLRGLPDGRIVVGGGEIQRYRIAELSEESLLASGPDHYSGLGEYVSADNCEVYDPERRAWSNLAVGTSPCDADMWADRNDMEP